MDPDLQWQLRRILDESTAGDPMSSLKWTRKSTRTIAAELSRRGHPVAWRTVARMLHDLGYSLQGNVKTVEGRQHLDRDAQLRYINPWAATRTKVWAWARNSSWRAASTAGRSMRVGQAQSKSLRRVKRPIVARARRRSRERRCVPAVQPD